MTLGKLWQSLFAADLPDWAARTGWSNWSCFSGCWVEVPAFLTLPELIPQPWQWSSLFEMHCHVDPEGFVTGASDRRAVLELPGCVGWIRAGERLCWVWVCEALVPSVAEGSSCSGSVSLVCAATAMATGAAPHRGTGMAQQHFHNKPELLCAAQSPSAAALPAWGERLQPPPHPCGLLDPHQQPLVLPELNKELQM